MADNNENIENLQPSNPSPEPEAREMVFPSGGSEPPDRNEYIEVEEETVSDKTESDKKKVTIFGKSFWDLWLMKIFRNIASVKYQWMVLMYIPVIYGMFHVPEGKTEPIISATAGLTFLGGGFITLATSRIIARTKLTEDNGDELNTDR